jgi:hypothetical protein
MLRPNHVSSQPSRNLVIVYTEGSQALSDWLTIKEKINAKAPDIDVRIVDNRTNDPAIRDWQLSRPSLVFSPCGLSSFKPAGGKIYVGRRIDKMEQIRRFIAAGLPTPRSVPLIPGLSLNPEIWGEFVLVKPVVEGGAFGRLIMVARAENVGTRFVELTHNGQFKMHVQRAVDAVDDIGRPFVYRALTVFERPLYIGRTTRTTPRPSLAEMCEAGSGLIAHNAIGAEFDRQIANDEDVIYLTRQVSAAMRGSACLGIDIVRERSTGELFVLETNPGGHVWHLSSDMVGAKLSRKIRKKMYNQFGALDVAADALIQKTREEASWFAA